MLSRLLAGALVIVLFPCWETLASEFPVTIVHGSNFYGQEQWGPGKLRRWMRNDAELHIENTGAPMRVDLRFIAESFRVPRSLRVRQGQQVLLEATVPPEPLYVVAKGVPLTPGETVITFSAVPGPDRVSRYRKSSDQRALSVAFGPFSAIDARAPEALREETAAFPQADRMLSQLSPIENTAGNLRREGRLLEAADAYRAVLASDRVNPTTYVWAALTLIALNDLGDARRVLAGGQHLGGSSPTALSIRRACSRVLDYLQRSELLAHQDQDPGWAFRERGEIYRAVTIYRGVLGQDPNNVVSSYWLGLLTGIAERPKEAVPLLQTVARSRPDSADAAMARDLQRYVGGR